MIGGTSVHNSINSGAYTGIFTNLSLAGMNNPSPNLTTVYLYNPLLSPTPDPLEYVPSPGRLGKPNGYPSIITGGGPSTGGFKRRPPPPPPPYSTHPRKHPPTGWVQPHRAKLLAQGDNRGESLGNCLPQGLERPNPLTHYYRHRGRGGQGSNWGPSRGRSSPFFKICNLGGNPWQNFGRRVRSGLTLPRTPTGTGGAAGTQLGLHQREQRAKNKFKIW